MAAISTQNVTVSLTAGMVTVQVGMEGHTFPLAELVALYKGHRSTLLLAWELVKRLRAQNVDPSTATLAQIKTAVEAVTYPWGA